MKHTIESNPVLCNKAFTGSLCNFQYKYLDFFQTSRLIWTLSSLSLFRITLPVGNTGTNTVVNIKIKLSILSKIKIKYCISWAKGAPDDTERIQKAERI